MSVLTEADIEKIHGASLEILSTVGVKLDDAEVFEKVCAAGADGDRAAGVVKMPESLVSACLAKCPRVVKLCDLAGRSVELRAGGDTVFWPGNALLLVKNGEAQEITSSDFVDLARVTDSLSNVHAMVGTSLSDYPAYVRDFVGFRLMAENTQKHFRPVIFTARGAEAILEMAKALLGSTPVRELPIVSFGYTIVSPLHWSASALGLFARSSGHGAPMMINSEPVAGATGPVTLAGALTLANAEALSGVVVVQVLEEGRPCIFNLGFAHTMDMTTAVTRTGGAENGLLAAAGAEIAQFHGLPSSSWMSTESMVPDAQASYEKVVTGLLHGRSRVNIIWGVGQLESQMTLSMEQAVIDNDLAGALLRAARGIEVSDESVALEPIKELAQRAEYISHPHTLDHFRDELYFPQVANRQRREVWEAAGAKTMLQAAEERVRDILAADPPEYLPEDLKAELLAIEGKWTAELGE